MTLIDLALRIDSDTTRIAVKLKPEDVARIDLTRIGFVTASNADGTVVVIEPTDTGWGDACRDADRRGLAAADIFANVVTVFTRYSQGQ